MRNKRHLLLVAIASLILSSCEFSITFAPLGSSSYRSESTSCVSEETSSFDSNNLESTISESSNQDDSSTTEEQPLSSSESGLVVSSNSEEQGTSSEPSQEDNSSSGGEIETEPTTPTEPVDEFDVDFDPEANIFVNIKELPTFDGSLEVHVSADARAKFYGVYSQNVTLSGAQYHEDRVQKVFFEENIVEVVSLPGSESLNEIHFSNCLEVLTTPGLFSGTGSNNSRGQTEVYFEGDCPKFKRQVFDFTGAKSIICYYKKGAEGYEDTFINGAPFYEENSTYTLPDWSLEEYAMHAAEKAEDIANTFFAEQEASNKVEMALIPEMNLDDYKNLREDTLEIVKDCTAQSEKITTIFNWVKNNIKYDINYLYVRPETCYKDRKAVCLQYCSILREMLTVIDVMSYVASCWADFPRDDISFMLDKKYLEADENHGHSILYYYLDGKAYACDPTWAAAGNDCAFNISPKTMSTMYLLINIENFDIVPDGIDIRAFKHGIFAQEKNGQTEYFFTKYGAVSGGVDLMLNYGYRSRIFVNNHDDNGNGQWNSVVRNCYFKPYEYMDFEGGYYCISIGRTCPVNDLIQYLTFRSSFTEIDKRKYGFLDAYDFTEGVCCKETEVGYSLIAYQVECSVVPEKVNGKIITEIGNNCFANSSGLTNLIISDNIVKIGDRAFEECRQIESVELGKNVRHIGSAAFALCSSLSQISFNDSLEYIGQEAFQYTVLESVRLGKNVSFERNPFNQCLTLSCVSVDDDNPYIRSQDNIVYSKDWSQLIFRAISAPEETFVSPEGLKTIGYEAFHLCKNLKTILINSGVETISMSAFMSSSIESLTIDQEATLDIRGQFVKNCPNLRDVNLGENVSKIGRWSFDGSAFYKDENNWVDGVLYCGNYAIASNGIGERYSLREGTVLIAEYVFYDDDSVKEVILPSSLEYCCSGTFEKCKSLQAFVIQNPNMKFLGNPFEGCLKLSNVYFVGSPEDLSGFFSSNSWLSCFYSSLFECVDEIPGELTGDSTPLEMIISPFNELYSAR